MKFLIYPLFIIGILFSTSLTAQNDVPTVTLEYQEVVDTTITFNPETFEESMQIVRRKIKAGSPVLPVVQTEDGVEIQIDTIITFDPKTRKETIQIVKRKKKN